MKLTFKITTLFFLMFSNGVMGQNDHYLAGLKDSTDTIRFVLYDVNGNLLVDETHDWFDVHRNGLIYRWKNKLAVVTDYDGTPLGIDSIQEVSNYVSHDMTIVPLKRNHLWGYYNLSGDLVIPHQFEKCGVFKNGKAPVKVGDSIYYVDTLGQPLEEPYVESWEGEMGNWYTAVTLTTGGGPPFVFEKKGKFGLRASKKKSPMIKPKYDAMYSINEFNIIVKINQKFGVLSFKDELVIPIKYDLILLLEENY